LSEAGERPRLLLLGSEGMLGQALVSALAPGFAVHAATWRTLDITDEAALARAFGRLGPAVAVNCAAFTDVDGCESRREEAFAVNARGAGNAARAAAAAGVFFVQISTDYVFDGSGSGPRRPGDPVGPINAYGESKLAGEVEVRAAGPSHLILRTAWLFGPGGRNFVATMLALGREKRELAVVDDQRGSPTYTRDLAGGIARLLAPLAGGSAAALLGTHHLTNSGNCTWCGFARAIFARAGISMAVTPVTSDRFPRPARRPMNSVLDCSSTAAALGAALPGWEDALSRYLAETGARKAPGKEGTR
jgi:dTDP-4-dehydrorhamnose reductase